MITLGLIFLGCVIIAATTIIVKLKIKEKKRKSIENWILDMLWVYTRLTPREVHDYWYNRSEIIKIKAPERPDIHEIVKILEYLRSTQQIDYDKRRLEYISHRLKKIMGLM